MKPQLLNKYASIICRKGQQFFDKELAPFQIGCGQQFFILRIHENQGISVLQLAQIGHFDKGTTTKAIQRLEELGYVLQVLDEKDKRIHRLYTTPMAIPLIEALYETRRKWNEILTNGMTEEEAWALEKKMHKLAENAYQYFEQGE